MLLTTAFFPLHGKSRVQSPVESYLDNFKTSTLVHAHYHVYGPADVCASIQKARNALPYRTTYTLMTWQELIILAEKEWGGDLMSRISKSRQYLSDSDTSLHAPSPELIFVWLVKCLLVKLTLESTHASHFSHYGWIDAGYRPYKDSAPPQQPFPCTNLQLIPNGKIIVSTDNSACHPQYFKPPQINCPIGGIWYGDYPTCLFFASEVSKEIALRLALPDLYSVVSEQDIYALVGFGHGILYVSGSGYNLPFLNFSPVIDHDRKNTSILLFWIFIFVSIIVIYRIRIK